MPMVGRCKNLKIRPVVSGEKAWLLSNSERGANASAALYNLIETAKANQHWPYQYFSWLFTSLPETQADYLDQLRLLTRRKSCASVAAVTLTIGYVRD